MRWRTITLTLCLLFPEIAAGGDIDDTVTCRVRVMDAGARAVTAAEVLAFRCVWDYGGGRIRWEPLCKTRRTRADGALSVQVPPRKDVLVVARKNGLAVGWDILRRSADHRRVTITLRKASVLAGTVMDEAGKPVPGARIRALLTSDFLRRRAAFLVGVPEKWFATQADKGGRFRFTNIPLDASADFLVTAPGRASLYTFQALDSGPGKQFAAGRTDIRIVMPPEARVEGRVVDQATGKPVSGVTLLARQDTRAANYYCPYRTVSGREGRFSLKGLPAATYSVQTIPPYEGMSAWVGGDVKVTTKAGEVTTGITIHVNEGGFIELSIRDAGGKDPLGDISFTVSQKASFGRHPSYYKSSRTGLDGRARVRSPLGRCDVYAGGWRHSSFRSEPIIVAKGKTSRLDIVLARDPRVSGTVRDETGKPVSGAMVDVLPVSRGAIQTGDKGEFEVSWRATGSPPRKYVLAQHAQRGLAAMVEIGDESSPLEVTLERTPTLAGTVTDPQGAGIPLARIQLQANLPRWLTRVGAETLTDATGRYEIPAIPSLPKGVQYRISIHASGHAPLSYERISLTKASDREFSEKTFSLMTANLSISGLVVDAVGRPIAGKTIHLADSRGGSKGQPRRTAVTDAAGRFAIDRICNGPLRLQAGYGKKAGFLRAKGGDRNVKIVLGQRGEHQPGLAGKQLPTLSALGLDLPMQGIGGGMVLLCFWDTEQRSSRHCLRELAKKAGGLGRKGIAVAAVHARSIQPDVLRKWLKTNNIPFPAGQVSQDPKAAQRQREAWGARALPWLILTDKKRVVRAEGFSLAEIDEKLKEFPAVAAQRSLDHFVGRYTCESQPRFGRSAISKKGETFIWVRQRRNRSESFTLKPDGEALSYSPRAATVFRFRYDPEAKQYFFDNIRRRGNAKTTRSLKLTKNRRASEDQEALARREMAQVLAASHVKKYTLSWHGGGPGRRDILPLAPGATRAVRVIRTSPIPPAGLKTPLRGDAKYARVTFSDAGRTSFICGLQKSSSDAGDFDRFFIDLNHNGRLDAGEVHQGELHESTMDPKSYVDRHFGTFDLSLRGKAGPRKHRVYVWRQVIMSRPASSRLYMLSHCYMTGTVSMGASKVKACLVDYNCDGRYDSWRPAESRTDRVGWDTNGDKKVHFREMHFVGSYVMHEGRPYVVSVSPEGDELAVTKVDVPVGTIRLPMERAFVKLLSQRGRVNLTLTDGIATLPAETYTLLYARRLLEDGRRDPFHERFRPFKVSIRLGATTRVKADRLVE